MVPPLVLPAITLVPVGCLATLSAFVVARDKRGVDATLIGAKTAGAVSASVVSILEETEFPEGAGRRGFAIVIMEESDRLAPSWLASAPPGSGVPTSELLVCAPCGP